MAGQITAKLEWAPGDGARSTAPSWTTITGKLRDWSVGRGRSDEGEEFPAGQFSGTLDNRSRLFDSEASTDDLIGSPIRLSAVYDGSTYPAFRGHITALNPQWADKGDQTVKFDAVDGLALAEAFDLHSPWTLAVQSISPQPRMWLRLNASTLEDGLPLEDSGSPGTFGAELRTAAASTGGSILAYSTDGLVTADSDSCLGFPSSHPAWPQGIALPSEHAVSSDSLSTGLLFYDSPPGSTDPWGSTERSAWTISAWARPDALDDTYPLFNIPGQSLNGSGFHISVSTGGKLRAGWMEGNGSGGVVDRFAESSAGAVTVGERFHVAVTCSTSRFSDLNLYLGGQLIVTSTFTGSTTPVGGRRSWDRWYQNSYRPYVGRNPKANSTALLSDDAYSSSGSTRHSVKWAGEIDEVIVWNSQLGSTVISDLYDAGKSSVWGDETAGPRITRVLDYLGWPSATGASRSTGRYIEDGASVMADADTTIDGQSAGEHIYEVGVRAERGRAYVNASGGFEFHDRHCGCGSTSSLTLSDDGSTGDSPWAALALRFDDSNIVNELHVQRVNDGSQIARSTASQDKYGKRDPGRMDRVWFANNADAAALAEYIVEAQNEPQLEAFSVQVWPERSTATAADVLGLELGDRVTVQATPSTGSGLAFDAIVEGVSHSGAPQEAWLTDLLISNPGPTDDFFILDSTSRGVLDTNKLGF